ncbi:hypothetical protein AB2B41_17880 [Marimonas sp. MJW-29]|uniref:Response regulatory domain-containing protein n=1 Tax=Sulfitobacter sediminis TaxID=3234186 RepID=A0ABV3RSC1_9RHOB
MKKNVLVYVPNGLIEDDVVATVREVHKGAEVKLVENIDAVCKTLSEHRGWAWAVLDAEPEELERADLREALVRNEALPVVLSQRIEDPAISDWVFLDPPFSTEMLRDALDKTRPY